MCIQLISDFDGQAKQNKEQNISFTTEIDHADSRWGLVSTLSIISVKVHNTLCMLFSVLNTFCYR